MIRSIVLTNFFVTQPQIIQIVVDQALGSAPRGRGTEMFVSASDRLGTIGGGQLEHRAIAAARKMLERGDIETQFALPLGPEIGQCCGGHVSLRLTLLDATQKTALLNIAAQAEQALPKVYIFGAGHVGRALATGLKPLPFALRLIDSRESEIALADPAIFSKVTPLPEAEIRQAPKGSAFVILTHDHSLDFQLAAEALVRRDAAYVGMIGSKTKRAALEKWIKQTHEDLATDALICPIGGGRIRNKLPEVIATFVAAELLVVFGAS